MEIDEKTRLDLRSKLEELMGPRLADVTMQAMPPLDYDQFATKTDVANLGIALRGDMAELRGDLRAQMGELRGDLRAEMGELRGDLRAEMGELRGDLRGEMAQLRNDLGGEMRSTVKTIVLANLGTSLAVGGFVIGLS